MEGFCLEQIHAGVLKGFISRNENIGIFSQNTQQIPIIEHRNLCMTNEIVIIVEIVIQKCHTQWQGQGYGRQEQRMFSQPLHSAFLLIRDVESNHFPQRLSMEDLIPGVLWNKLKSSHH
jgi:hypothetical protein